MNRWVILGVTVMFPGLATSACASAGATNLPLTRHDLYDQR